ncbi:IS110 family RNA-guided transposase [Blastomonas aquatica]|uniref:IS110 family transposase n=1 Tax=Blastomonas aquatica TaxID=1510276 RepID=A0ABQ1J494_9SPHN|nr:IS110 family transposase [Blastomonas aquatica]GGB58417.1 IS110 family transposase [Blastomonas aquatica]
MEQVSVVGLDLAKSVFQVHGVNAQGEAVLRRKLSRGQLLKLFEKLPPCLVGMEACASAHHWARELAALGHQVKLMPPQYVKPYVKRGKNDAADAEAICEAVTRPTMRFVGVKSPDQQATIMLHRVRKILTRQRTQLSNALRAHMAEFGVTAAIGRGGLDRLIAVIAGQHDARLPDEARACLFVLSTQLEMVKNQILDNDRRILADARRTEAGRRLMKIPGIGPLLASAIVACVPDPSTFGGGRSLSAWIGLTPRQNSSGGKERLGSITKAGNTYLRELLVVGAMAVVRRAKQGSAKWPWVAQLLERKKPKVAAVALANKNARIIWAMMATGEPYREPELAAA